MKYKLLYPFILLFLSLFLVIPVRLSDAQGVGNVVGTAVTEDPRIGEWNNSMDAAAGDNLTRGVPASQVYGYDGTNYDRIRGDTTYGLDVDVTRMPSSGGNNFYAIKRANIGAASVNLPFGFTSNTVIVEVPGSNTDNIIVDWAGGTAVAPAANTAGDDILEPGRTVVLDWFNGTSISVIAASGTQTVYVRAFN